MVPRTASPLARPASHSRANPTPQPSPKLNWMCVAGSLCFVDRQRRSDHRLPAPKATDLAAATAACCTALRGHLAGPHSSDEMQSSSTGGSRHLVCGGFATGSTRHFSLPVESTRQRVERVWA